MAWYAYVAYFFAGVFLANGVPHFVHGVAGRKFQSPFASPPGVGASSPVVNVIWGSVNFAAGYALIYGAGESLCGFSHPVLMVALGGLVTAIFLALYFGRVR